MKKISSKHLRLNKINVSKVSRLIGGNPTKNPNQTDDCPEDTQADTCTTSRYTVDFASNATTC
ncbi:hypothetical protein KORDIASMS9_03735 [Kordia sp. SMS9]|uniref:hypothetical protein n=1 Tax=Kordia sp. SMS9 TaxID=2282170 RepID=UPI000E1027D0|nr:hypothetical protein [Kordia sp. SMS9]AXG71478.1 hypothetical protein KORDIASMS9_03735 [Kordia sp. SMS9]